MCGCSRLVVLGAPHHLPLFQTREPFVLAKGVVTVKLSCKRNVRAAWRRRALEMGEGGE
jgi:hypothetical protein